MVSERSAGFDKMGSQQGGVRYVLVDAVDTDASADSEIDMLRMAGEINERRKYGKKMCSACAVYCVG